MLDKFQGNINKVIEEDSSVELDEIHSLEGNTVQNNMQMRILEQQLQVLDRKNQVLLGQSPNLVQLPLMFTLLTFQLSKSFIDKKTCLNEMCAQKHHQFVPNYFSDTKLVLLKHDGDQKDYCHACNNNRYCAIYECKYC